MLEMIDVEAGAAVLSDVCILSLDVEKKGSLKRGIENNSTLNYQQPAKKRRENTEKRSLLGHSESHNEEST